MNKEILLDFVIKENFCIGCGACASVNNSDFNMIQNENGQFVPIQNHNNAIENDVNYSSICPFSHDSKDENQISENLFKQVNGIKHHKYIGYYLDLFSSYVKIGSFRENGSSGGFGTYISVKLFQNNLINKVVHVKSAVNNGLLFDYQISNTIDEIKNGGKSKYYPSELSQVVKEIENSTGDYLIFGVPCFIKAIRLLMDTNPILKARIKFCIGLVCGHMKSTYFADSLISELGVNKNSVTKIDFRKKYENKRFTEYGVEITSTINNINQVCDKPVRELTTTNWGYGFFKYNACDYCDDVLAETADLTIGDAWLPKYTKEELGTNIVIVRNLELLELVLKYKDEIFQEKLSIKEIYKSQLAGFRHKREGLRYRLYVLAKGSKWYPKKRISPSKNIPNWRKEVYIKRIELNSKSIVALKKAIKQNDFESFKEDMKIPISEYNQLFKRSKLSVIKGRIENVLFSIFD